MVGWSGISSAAESTGFFDFGIVRRDGEVPAQTLDLGPLHGAAADRRAKLIFAHSRQIDDGSHVPCLPGLPLGSGGGGCRAVPWTDFLTNVASVDMRSDR